MRCVGFAVLFLLLASVGVADVLWDNGAYDGRTGFSSCRELGSNNPVTWTADDFRTAAPWHITATTAQFYAFMQDGSMFELADIAIWEEPWPGSKPGRQVVFLQNLPIEWEQIGEGYGLPIISATVKGLDIHLPPGDYFFSMALVVTGSYGDNAYLCTTGNGTVRGRNGGWWWYFNWQNWTPVWRELSTRFWLTTSDFAFSLEGERE